MRDDPTAWSTTATTTLYAETSAQSITAGDRQDDQLWDRNQAAYAAWLGTELGLSSDEISELFDETARNGTDAAVELIASGRMDAVALACAIADRLGLEHRQISDGDLIVSAADAADGGGPSFVRTCDQDRRTHLFIAPRLQDLSRLARILDANAPLRAHTFVTTRSDIRSACAKATSEQRFTEATAGLSVTMPEFSAKQVLLRSQAPTPILAAALLAFGLYYATSATLLAIHLASAIGFSACVILRLAATLEALPSRPTSSPATSQAEHLPLYSILVALHKESPAVIDPLIDSLSALDWPVSLIEIKLICEADDPETIIAVERAIARKPQFESVIVPAGEPRTKPKALSFALPLVSGEFVVLYDAEDRPDRHQLREAHARFRSGSPNLACLQAPLDIDNGEESWLTALFALEYGGLFGRLLPFLARHRLPIPLGGTSNHFRRSQLIKVGGWDSHNVTEDADLGIRLARAGLTVGTLARPTLEHAPERVAVWHRQRSRWIKGWAQTVLIHLRRPRRLLRDLGWRNTGVFLILFLGMLASSIAFPIFLILAAATAVSIWMDGAPSGWFALLFALDIANAIGGFASFVLLARGIGRVGTRWNRWRAFAMLPAYWLLTTVAAARGFRQLLTEPHRWEKTPHDMRSRADGGDPRYRTDPQFGDRSRGPS